MKKIKSVHISILIIVVFLAALFLGMQSNWWRLEGRKLPSDFSIEFGGNETQEHSDEDHEDETENTEEEHSDEEEEHESTVVSGSSTVQDAVDLGIPLEKIEEILAGEVEDTDQLIKTIVTERGLKFGEVKDALNALLK